MSRRQFGVLLSVTILAGCGTAVSPTTPAVVAPTSAATNSAAATPAAAMTVEPPSLTPGAITTRTPAPRGTPLADSPITRVGVLKQLNAYEKGSRRALEEYARPIMVAALTRAYRSFAATQYSAKVANHQERFAGCLDSKITDPQINEAVRTSTCARLTYDLLLAAEQSGGNPIVVAFATGLLRYDVTVALGREYLYMLRDLIALCTSQTC